ncbi:hypothetical protein C8J56DRAFT_249291 [Mycena floridula]|nr:hypothetical protein C8J56DRAFT_249291 [Mycena floridula]
MSSTGCVTNVQLHSVPECNVDLIFVIKKEAFMWVVLRVVGAGSDATISPETVEMDASGLLPGNLFPDFGFPESQSMARQSIEAFQMLLAPSEEWGQFPMLRVLASFQASPVSSASTAPDESPLGIFDKLFQRVTTPAQEMLYGFLTTDEAPSQAVVAGIISSLLRQRATISASEEPKVEDDIDEAAVTGPSGEAYDTASSLPIPSDDLHPVPETVLNDVSASKLTTEEVQPASPPIEPASAQALTMTTSLYLVQSLR